MNIDNWLSKKNIGYCFKYFVFIYYLPQDYFS